MHSRRAPSEILDEFTWLDLQLLHARYVERPFGDERYQLALLSAATVNSNPFRGEKAKSVAAEDFLPRFVDDKPQSVSEQLGLAQLICQTFGGKS